MATVLGEIALVTFIVIVFAVVLLGIGLFWFFICEECVRGTIAILQRSPIFNRIITALKRGSLFKEG